MAGGERRKVSRLLNAWRRIFHLLSARWLTPALTGFGLLVLLISLVLLSADSLQVSAGIELALGGAEVTRLMATEPLVALYFVILVIHLLCRWAAGVIEDRRPPSLATADEGSILADAWRYAIVLDPWDWAEHVDARLAQGARVSTSEGRAAYRMRPSRIPLRTWQMGLLVVLAGIVLSTLVRESGSLYLGEGQVVQVGAPMQLSRYDWRFPDAAAIAMPFEAIRLDRRAVDLALDERLMPVGGPVVKWPISARFSYLAKDREHQFTARAFPPTLVRGSLFSLNGVGLGPRVVATYDGQTVTDSFAILQIVPGQSSSASTTVDPIPYTLDFTLLPNADVPLVDSPYLLQLVDDERGVVASATVGPFAGALEYKGWSISVPETRPWAILNITRDPALLLVVGGVLVWVVGFAAWLVVLMIGWESWVFVEESSSKGDRLYVGVDASRFARSRARKRLEELLRDIEN